jgi:hypothetical protein
MMIVAFMKHKRITKIIIKYGKINSMIKINIQNITRSTIHYEIEYLDDFYYIPTSTGEVSLFVVLNQSLLSH